MKNRHFALLIAASSSFVFLMDMLLYGYTSLSLNLFGAASAILFVAYAASYTISSKKLTNWLLVAYAISYIAAFAFDPAIAKAALFSGLSVHFFVDAVLYAMLYLPVLFLLFIGAYFLRIEKKRKLAFLAIAIAALVIGVYYLSGYIFKGYVIDDEVYITFVQIHNLMQKINPYATNIAPMLYYNRSITGISVTTNNTVMGMMYYPDLFFLSSFPFYFLSKPSLQNYSGIDTTAEAMVFIFIMLFSIAMLVRKESLKKPPYGLLVILFVTIPIVSSIQTYLMFAFLAIAYTFIESRYSWLFLGIAASLQEELWIPVLLLIVYSLANKGIKAGLKDAAGTAFAFLIINSYFIAINPKAFFGSVFSPVSRYLFVSDTAPLGYLTLTRYHMLYGTFTTEFFFAVLAMAVLFAYFNKKELLGIFSMLPFFFLQHATPTYYTFFTLFFIFSLYVEKGRTKEKSALSKKHALAMFLAIAVAMVLLAYNSHLLYAKGFNLKIVDQSAYIAYSANGMEEAHYTGKLLYSSLATNTLYLAFGVSASTGAGLMGFANSPLISNPAKCNETDYSCLVNVNRILLNNSTGTYMINATIPLNKNISAYWLEPYLYNGKYFYSAPTIEAKFK